VPKRSCRYTCSLKVENAEHLEYPPTPFFKAVVVHVYTASGWSGAAAVQIEKGKGIMQVVRPASLSFYGWNYSVVVIGLAHYCELHSIHSMAQ